MHFYIVLVDMQIWCKLYGKQFGNIYQIYKQKKIYIQTDIYGDLESFSKYLAYTDTFEFCAHGIVYSSKILATEMSAHGKVVKYSTFIQ